ncbi:MFS general substrate transporter [Patellaria atrata CBS 101060]|uniref:MFS general substrate transporter n=1 Tax=Patellaria atrata CBS 101060 TaxID=1346257 RepID=A0A9P4S7Y7_9PEZI|nr:MFS general substrate transporter [Patellaria atrata CBS 101060]
MASKAEPYEAKTQETVTNNLETSGNDPDRIETIERKEIAAKFLEDVDEDLSFTPEEEKHVLHRIDRRVLSLILVAYFFQQLDKSSLSYVSIFGIVEDADLVGKQYSWLGSILYFAQLVMQPLAAFLLVKAPTGKLIAGAILLWGASLAIMSSCTNFPSLLGMRFTLGAFEAMIAPSCVAVTQMWWRRNEQTLRTTLWNAMNGITFIVGSLTTYGLGHIKTDKLYSYQIIFMFCGLWTVLYSLLVWWLMPDSPMEAKFLSQREKVVAIERLRANQMGIISREWRWDHFWETIYDLKTWCWFFIVLVISIASGGIGTFGNLIVKSFGYDKFHAILFNMPFGIVQAIVTILAGWVAQKTQRKGYVIVGCAIPAMIGAILMLTVDRTQKGVLLFGYYMVSCMAAITPMIYAWEAQNTAGDTKRKCTSAVVFIGMCTGNIIGPQLYSPDQAPLYRAGLISSLIMFALSAIFAILITFYLMYLNKRHAKRRQELGKSAHIIDESMVGKDKIGQMKATDMEDNTGTHRRVGEHSFADMTDLKNEDFIFVY